MKKYVLIIAGILCMLASCENELPFDVLLPEMDIITEVQDDFVPNEGMIQLGRRLENPYSLENMRKALELLPTESRGGFSAEDIQPTHLYVKFAPANVEEFDALLWSDNSIEFYPYPLDYERQTGGYYHDPSLPENVPTYQYASIPVGRPIPEVCEYEILEELYIPDELSDYTRTLSPAFINAIVAKSFEITGNERTSDAVATRSDGLTRASYTYSGTIKVRDDLLGQDIPVVGAIMRCTRWFTTVKAITNTNGYYTMTRESQNEYHYDICWERDNKYDIREGELSQAITEGPKQVSGWSVTMRKDNGYPRGVNFATINRAAYRYFYGNTGGLNRLEAMPTGNLKISYMHESNNNVSGSFADNGFFNISGDIFIYGKDSSGNLRGSNFVFSTAVHEMTHSNHFAAMEEQGYEYDNVTKFIKESWAVFGQSLLFYLEYGELGLYNMTIKSYEDIIMEELQNYENSLHGITRWPGASENLVYSTLFMDLYDDHNQLEEWGQWINFPNDNITGYSASILNSIVNISYNAAGVKTQLKANKPVGVTNAMIDDFVDYFSEIYNNRPNQ